MEKWLCVGKTNKIELYEYCGFYGLLEKPFCQICGNPKMQTQNCTWHRNLYGFNRIYVMGKYFPPARKANADLLSEHILRLKSEKKYAKPLGEALAFTVKQFHPELLKHNLIVPVPLHPNEYGKRGYNQALELAKVVGTYLQIAVQHVLQKTKVLNMRPLKWTERREAVKGLYKIIKSRKNQICNKNIILVDDIVTSGFTVSECAVVLLTAGAKQVDVLALARTVM